MKRQALAFAALLTGTMLPVANAARAAHAQNIHMLRGTTLDGAMIGAADLVGKVVIVNFWATWCAPCRAELPAFDQWAVRHRNEGAEVIAISGDDPAKIKAVRAVASSLHVPVAMMRDVHVPSHWLAARLPVTLIFGRDGSLRFDSRTLPPFIFDAATLERVTAPLIAEQRR